MTKNTALLAVVLCSSLLFAKDKKEESAPSLTPQQRIELLTLQRDAAIKAAEAQPYILRMQDANQRLQNKVQELMKEVDQSKWSLDFLTLEFSAVPTPAKTGMRDAVPSGPQPAPNPPPPPNPNNRPDAK